MQAWQREYNKLFVKVHWLSQYRSAVEQFGLFDQLRTDHGWEFYWFIQEQVRATFSVKAPPPEKAT